jgi:hypothetical protein
MLRRSLLVFVVGPFVLVGSCAALAEVVPVQAVIKAPLGLSVRLATRSDQAVKLTIELPKDYGLTPQERREGWEPLNHANEQIVVLGTEPTSVVFPPTNYCAYYFRWNGPPPPPARFVLRFSDAPDERYLVWGGRKGSAYLVTDGKERIPDDAARWALRISPLTRDGADRSSPWTVDVDVFPQAPQPRTASVQP